MRNILVVLFIVSVCFVLAPMTGAVNTASESSPSTADARALTAHASAAAIGAETLPSHWLEQPEWMNESSMFPNNCVDPTCAYDFLCWEACDNGPEDEFCRCVRRCILFCA